MEEQGTIIDGVRLVPLSEDHEPVAYAEQSDIERLEKQIIANAEVLAKLRRFAPPVAVERARQIRLTVECAGLLLAAAGAWWIYRPAALLLVGAWLLGDVIVSRRRVQKK